MGWCGGPERVKCSWWVPVRRGTRKVRRGGGGGGVGRDGIDCLFRLGRYSYFSVEGRCCKMTLVSLNINRTQVGHSEISIRYWGIINEIGIKRYAVRLRGYERRNCESERERD